MGPKAVMENFWGLKIKEIFRGTKTKSWYIYRGQKIFNTL